SSDLQAGDVDDEIEGIGGKAVLVTGDVSERTVADNLLRTATERFGGPDIVVNNAGVVRDRMLFNMSDEEFDTVLRVHLRGHFLLCRNAAAHWRRRSKEAGAPVYGRVINTASEAFLVGAEGQPNYAAAKAGIAALTTSTARATARYGVRANAICPRARTAMTSDVFGSEPPAEGPDPLSADHVTPLVAYLASPASDPINGQVFVVHGGKVALMSPPTVEARFDTTGDGFDAAELDEQLGGYFAERDPDATFAATDILSL